MSNARTNQMTDIKTMKTEFANLIIMKTKMKSCETHIDKTNTHQFLSLKENT